MTTTNKTLLINFYANNITENNKIEFTTAIEHEFYSMNIQLAEANKRTLEKKLVRAEKEDSTATPEEIEGIKASINKLMTTINQLQEDADFTLDVYNKVVETMSLKNENHFGNDKNVVMTVLRVLAALNDTKLMKYAIIPAFKTPELYDALETIHITSKAGEVGNLTMNKEVKEAYKKASDELERIIKVHFSLPFETPYTSKTRIKITAEDKKLLHDCYIKGFANKFSTDEDGNISFNKRTINTLVSKKINKKTNEIIYDYSKLATTICNIVIKHYFK